jgi:hypothetical protein
MNIDDVINQFQEVADALAKDGESYLKQANVITGSKISDLTPEQTGCGYSAGTYKTCAKAINDKIKQLRQKQKSLDYLISDMSV